MRYQKNRSGFTPLIVIAIVALVAVLGGFAYYSTTLPSSQSGRSPVADEDKIDAMLEKDDGAVMEEKKEGDTMMEEDKKDEGAMVDKNEGDVMVEKKEEGQAMVKFSGQVLAGTSSPLLAYNKTDFDVAVASGKLVVLYFYANWCPICLAEFPKMEDAFDQISGDGVVGFRVNYNDNETDADEKALARTHGVAYQHTKVFLKNGQRVLKSPETWDTSRYLVEINAQLK
jgi:thiol-disulfide isomerase/thioredoxin